MVYTETERYTYSCDSVWRDKLISNNPFAYCENNPVNDSDPSGNVGIETVVGALFGAVLSAVGFMLGIIVDNYSLLSNVKTPKTKLKEIVKVISNQIFYYLKQNSTLYKRYFKKYSLSSATSWIYGKF